MELLRYACELPTVGTRPARVAVVVPVYNGERYLAETLESLVVQEHRDWTAVVVDDGSTDRSPEVAAAFAARHPDRFTVIHLERNLGVANARNEAVRATGGAELIALLDHDDKLLPRYLGRMLELYDDARADGRRAGIVTCNARLLTDAGLLSETLADRFSWVEEVDLDSLLTANCIFARALLSREAFDAVGGFAPECAGCDDWDLWLRIVEAGYEVISTREPLAVYRFHSGAQSCDQGRMAESNLVAYRRALRRGALTPRQRRLVRAGMRHRRALRDRARVYAALEGRRRARALVLAVRAAPSGVIAFAQDPSRWGEWLRGLMAFPGRDLSRDRRLS